MPIPISYIERQKRGDYPDAHVAHKGHKNTQHDEENPDEGDLTQTHKPSAHCAKYYMFCAGEQKLAFVPRRLRNGHSEQSLAIRPNDSAVTRFNRLIKEWRDETGGLSIARQIHFHPTYLKIIGMGHEAIPFLLAEVRKGRRFLFMALESIAEERPAADAKTFEEASDAWIQWGRNRGLI